MSFHSSKTEEFLANFAANEEKIRSFYGCLHLDLLRDIKNPSSFFTYSHWIDEEALENYRHSELFKGVWAKTKVLFNDKPEAWSVYKVNNQSK